jgi:signal peptidase II
MTGELQTAAAGDLPASLPTSWRKRWPLLIVPAAVVTLDQISKRLVDTRLALHEDYPLISGCLSLQYVRNRGAAFGLLSQAGLPFQSVLLTLVSLLAFGAIAVYAWRQPAGRRWPQLALALIMGGAVGNLVDRVRLGYVIDFVRVYWQRYDWPNFNVADSAITVGVCLLVLDLLHDSQTTNAGEAATAAGRTD